MAWSTSNEGVPYIKPVAPEITPPDNTAAKIIAGTTDTIVHALMQGALARQQAQLDREKMVQDADLKSRELDIMGTKSQQDYELKKVLYGSYKTNAEANQTRAKTAAERLMQGNKEAADAQSQIDKTVGDFTARGNELKVFDAERQTKDSIGFAADLQKLTDEYGNAPSYTGIPARLSSLQSIADQQKIYLPLGATYDPDNKEWTGNTTSSPVPIWQVVKGLQDPATHDTWKNILTASGHITSETKDVPMEERTSSWKRPIDTVWDKFVKGAAPTKKVTTDKADAQAQGILDSARKVDFSRSQNRVPEAIPKLTRPQAGKYGTGLDTGEPLPLPDLPPDASAAPASSATPPTVDPTMTDTILKQAHAAYAANPGARDEILKRLAAKGIDPALFDKFNVAA